MAAKKTSSSEPTGNIVHYKDADGREHYASRTAPHVALALESGEYTLIEEVAPDGPTVSRTGSAAEPGSAGS